MKTLMLGWEFPPSVSGGLGVACYGLAKGLNSLGVDVLFLLPKPLSRNGHSRILGEGAVQEVKEVPAATPVQVHNAVEHAVENAELQHVEEATPPAPPPPLHQSQMHPPQPARTREEWVERSSEHVEEKWEPREGVEQEKLQRVTFIPVDVWLEPYMTPVQYQRMVVEEIVRDKPIVRWEKRFERRGQKWVERIVIHEASPNASASPPPGTHAGPVLRPVMERPKRAYLDEPENLQPIMGQENTNYAGDLFAETERYAALALSVARSQPFDVIHAHDWMTFEAAMAVANETGKPLIVQIHSTELDRAGDRANARILEIEREGMLAATRIIAVSYKTKNQLVDKYGIDPAKIDVVYNATDPVTLDPVSEKESGKRPRPAPKKKHKTVLFLGRMVQQKGPDYFLRAAKKILSVEPDVKFIMAGKGEMVEELKELAEELGIHRRVIFTGFLKKAEAEKTFKAADVYVMPSVSEPFGIAPLEALSHDVPVIISKQSGVAEVLHHVLKVDFWDTEEMANKILAILRHPPLAATLRENGQDEAKQLSWDDSAKRVAELYDALTRKPDEAPPPAEASPIPATNPA